MKSIEKNIYVDVGMRHGWLLIIYVVTAIIINVVVVLGNEYLARATDTMLAGETVNFGELFIPLAI